MIAARRFFVEGAKEIGETVEIGGTDAHKIANVLRLSAGDRIVVIDSAARTFTAAIATVGRIVRTTIEEEIFEIAHPPRRCGSMLHKPSRKGAEWTSSSRKAASWASRRSFRSIASVALAGT